VEYRKLQHVLGHNFWPRRRPTAVARPTLSSGAPQAREAPRARETRETQEANQENQRRRGNWSGQSATETTTTSGNMSPLLFGLVGAANWVQLVSK